MVLREVAAAKPGLPRNEQWRDQMLDAVILAAGVVARASGPGSAAVRMCLLAETRRAGLVGTPPHRDVLAAFAAQSTALAHPTAARRVLSRTMNLFVGTPWAATIATIAANIAYAGQASDVAIIDVRRALGLGVTELC